MQRHNDGVQPMSLTPHAPTVARPLYRCMQRLKEAEAAAKPWAQKAMTKIYWSETWVHIKHEARHYWQATKLLAADARIASRLLFKSVGGVDLSRRERRQFVRTVSDLLRVVPFSAFVIVPGAELLLPFVIKIFPSMLPTPYRDAKVEGKKKRVELRVKLEMAKFLQETIDEMALQQKGSRKAGKNQFEGSHGLAELATVFKEGRTHARDIPTTELLKFSSLFSDTLTLDKLSHPQLVALCKLLLLPTYGASGVLNFQLRMKLRELHADDLLIQRDGVESLTVKEVQEACHARGMRALGVSEEGLRERLNQWIRLHVVEKVPSSLLLMSRVLYLPETLTPEAQIATVLDNLPENIKDEVQVTAAETEAVFVDPEARLAVLESEEALIKEEREEKEALKAHEEEKQKERERKKQDAEMEEQLRAARPGCENENEVWDKEPSVHGKTLSAQALATAPLPADDDAEEEQLVSREELKELTETIFEDNMERGAVDSLKEEISGQESKLDSLQAEPDLVGMVVPKGSRVLLKQLKRLVADVDSSIKQSEERHDASHDLGIVEIDINKDGLVSVEELVMVFRNLLHSTDPEKDAKLRTLAQMLDFDDDGIVKVGTLNKMFTLVLEEGAATVTINGLRRVVETITKEELADDKEQHRTRKSESPRL